MDDVDDLLTPKAPPAETPKLRNFVFDDARRVQRRRRWFIRGRRIGIVAICYAAGMASMWYRPSKQKLTPPIVVERQPAPAPSAGPPISVDPYRNDPPEVVEKWAFLQTGEKRVELYRRAGDGYLLRDDVQGALRCYRRALDGATAADLAIHASSDTWLLISLKMARTKERSDARVN